MKSCCEANAPPGGCECGRRCPLREERDIGPDLLRLLAVFVLPLKWLQRIFRQ